MAKLWQTLLRRSSADTVSRYSVEQYLTDIAAASNGFGFGYGGSSPANKTEDIENNFTGYVQQAYKSNGVIFAIVLARLLLFSEGRFCWYEVKDDGETGEAAGIEGLDALYTPWPNGDTAELLARMEQDVTFGGNFYAARENDRLRRLRPDWLTIVLTAPPAEAVESDVAGYWYHPGRVYGAAEPSPGDQVYLPDEVCAWSPIPDPEAQYRGMSWLTPVLRELRADSAATSHKLKFFENGATLGTIISAKENLSQKQFDVWKATILEQHQGVDAAYKPLFLASPVDVSIQGVDMKQLDFKISQGGGETRLCAAAQVPPIIVGLSEGIAAATYCLPGDSLVWTAVGPTPIRDIRPGVDVWSHVDGGLALKPVTWQARTGEKAIYTIRTRNRVLRASGSHPVLVRVPGNLRGGNNVRQPSAQWRTVEQLQPGDCVVQVMHLPEATGYVLPDGTEATPDTMRWLGAYVGDGCLSGDGEVRMCIPVADRVRDEYEKLAPTLFAKATAWPTGRTAADGLTDEMVRLRQQGLTYRQIVETMSLDLHPMSVRDRVQLATRDYSADVAPVVTAETRNGFRFNSKAAVQWHRDMGVTGRATTKRVPTWVFSLRKDLRLQFLAGLVDTDGSIDKRGSLKFQFANRLLVEDVRMLLVGCGIQCSNLYEQTYRADVLPNPGRADSYVAWAIVASSADEVAQIPFTDWLYRERVETNVGRQRRAGKDAGRAGLDDCLGFFTVRSVDSGEVEPVYDISVEDGASFVADGVVVHNSNYSTARRKFGDHWARPTWKSASAALSTVVTAPRDGLRLGVNEKGIAFLREDMKDAAEIESIRAGTISSYIASGFTPDSSVSAAVAGDPTLLVHTGLTSVQLQPPMGEEALPGDPGLIDDTGEDPGALEDLAASLSLRAITAGVNPAARADVNPGDNGNQLKHYWLHGEGLAKWAASPHPWTSLYHHLVKHMPPEKAKRVASDWFHEHFGFHAGSDMNRVTHGKPPRGDRVGPG